MDIKPFDQFNKNLFQQLLSPFGTVISNRALFGGERTIDIFFQPDPTIPLNPEELGNLAQMSGQTALFEPARSALTDQNVHNYLLKLFLLYAELQNSALHTIPTQNLPQLWILAAEVSDLLLREFSANPDSDQGEGFYRLANRLRTTIIVIDELPNTPDTLWLRLTGKGRTQEDAIAELLLLPESNPKRETALDLLVSWRISMELLDQVDQEERQILMALSQAYLEWEQKTEQRGIERGVERGAQQAQQKTIASILSTRFGQLDRPLEALIPALMELPIETVTPLLLQLTRQELLDRFTP
jgi:hypothetical protein